MPGLTRGPMRAKNVIPKRRRNSGSRHCSAANLVFMYRRCTAGAFSARCADPRSNGVCGAVLPFVLTHSVKQEAEHPNCPREKKVRAGLFVHTLPVELTEVETGAHGAAIRSMQGSASPYRHAADALHLFEAAKYGGCHFITWDKRILKKAGDGEQPCGLRAVTPALWTRIYRAHPPRRPRLSAR